jgi:hypothetical protein
MIALATTSARSHRWIPDCGTGPCAHDGDDPGASLRIVKWVVPVSDLALAATASAGLAVLYVEGRAEPE